MTRVMGQYGTEEIRYPFRLCEAVTPALTKLHPSSILDNLHFRCLDRLKSQNRLTKAQDNNDPDTPDSPDSDEGPGVFDATQRQFNGEGKSMEVKTSSYQALLTLSRVCFIFLISCVCACVYLSMCVCVCQCALCCLQVLFILSLKLDAFFNQILHF